MYQPSCQLCLTKVSPTFDREVKMFSFFAPVLINDFLKNGYPSLEKLPLDRSLTNSINHRCQVDCVDCISFDKISSVA